MPARKNTKNKTGLSSLEERASPSIAEFEREVEAGQVPSPSPRDPGTRRRRASSPEQVGEEEMDEPLILTYLAFYHLLERLLVQAGFSGSTAAYKQPRPDWYRWARRIEKEFDPASSEELRDAVEYLLSLRDEMEELPGRLQNRIQWESVSPYSDVLWLTEMLQHTSVQLTHRYNLVEMPGCSTPQVMAALFVVQAWLELVSGE